MTDTASSSASSLVRTSTGRGVATLTLDSPHNRNALSRQLVRELAEGLDAALADDAVRVVVLTHTGTVFCSGADLKEARGASSDGQPVVALTEVLTTIWRSPKPVVARLAGPARAGGLGLVAACDLAVAARSATFAFTEVRLGLVPAVISVVCLPRMTDRRATELLLTGETFDADTAAEGGLLTRAVDDEALDVEVDRLVDALRKGSPSALATTKDLVRSVPGRSLEEAFAAMTQLSAERFASEEGQEGIRAFAEKRAPRWVPTD